jgi:GT2 family glycosyltransferase
MSNISLLVAIKNNLDYTKHFYKTTRAIYPEVEICFSSYNSTDGTHEWLDSLNDPFVKIFHSNEYGNFSDNYNKAASLATKEYIAFTHNDIVLTPGFIENLEKHLSPNNIVSYTTIEPPIFAGHERPGKIVKDLGVDLETFDIQSLYNFAFKEQNIHKDQIIEDISFFMCMPRKTYIEIGGLDNLYDPMFCEDIDLCVRFKLLGLKFIMSLDAITYHFVSKTSRFSEEYKDKTAKIERNSNLNFIRKWGTYVKPIEMLSPNKYNIGFMVKNCNQQLLEVLEPWCSTLYVDCNYNDYIKKEQPNTKFNLGERIKPYHNEKQNDILIEFDALQFSVNQFNLIQHLSDIIKESSEIGVFELDIFNVHIYNLERKNLINN